MLVVQSAFASGTFDDATWLEPGESVYQVFSQSGENHYFRFNLTEGAFYLIETHNVTSQAFTDTVLYTYFPDETLLAKNDDDLRFPTRNSRLILQAPMSGTFFATVYEYNSMSGGNYSITLTRLGTPHIDFAVSNMSVRRNQTFTAYANVTCIGGDCGNVTVILDPINEEMHAKDRVDPAVLKEIEQNPDVSVIVRMRESLEFPEHLAVQADRVFTTAQAMSARVGRSDLESLLNDPDVEYVYLNREVTTMLDMSVPSIRAPQVWDSLLGAASITGKGTSVCVIDTGVDYTHPHLGGCAPTNDINDGSCEKVIGGYDFVNDNANPMDDEGHGTHVAAIVASDNDTYRGVAPDAKIVAVKSLDSGGSGSIANVIAGIEYCTAMREEYNISVISMSLGGGVYTGNCDRFAEREAIDAAIEEGILVVAAAGNNFQTDSKLGVSAPSCMSNAMSIAATDNALSLTSFSKRDIFVDLAAPGQSIQAAQMLGNVISKSGTSMATPHVAGAAVLVREYFRERYDRELDPDAIRWLLKSSGNLTDPESFADLSFSRVDVFSAIGAKGIVPMQEGAQPFWTAHENPTICTLNENDTCSLSWNVTATGPSDDYLFFSLYETEYDFGFSNAHNVMIEGPRVNVTYYTNESLVEEIESPAHLREGNYTILFTSNEPLLNLSFTIISEADNLSADAMMINDTTFTYTREIAGVNATGSVQDEMSLLITDILGISYVQAPHASTEVFVNTIPPSIVEDTPSAQNISIDRPNLTIILEFSESMDVLEPDIFLTNVSSAHEMNGTWIADDTYALSLAVSAENETTLAGLRIENATDLASNPMLAYERTILIDMQAPIIENLSVNHDFIRPTSEDVTILLEFSEALTAMPDISLKPAIFADCTPMWETAKILNVSCPHISGEAESDELIIIAENTTDLVGNALVGSVVHPLLIDTLAPRIHDAFASAQIIQNQTNLTVFVNVTDAHLEDVRIDGVSASLNETSGLYARSMIVGSSSVEILAIDTLNNTAQESVGFTIDTIPPTTTATLRVNQSTVSSTVWHNSSVSVDLNASDANGIDVIRYRIGSGAWQNYEDTILISTNGIHALSYYAIDLAGNQEARQKVNVRVDTSAPHILTATTTSPAYTSTDTIEVLARVTDALSGVEGVWVDFDGDSYPLTRSGSWYSGMIDNPGEGIHVGSVRARDRAGNTNETLLTVVVNDTIPTITASIPNASAVMNGTLLTFTIANAQSASYETSTNMSGDFTDETTIVLEGSGDFFVNITAQGATNLTLSYQYLIDTEPPLLSVEGLSGVWSGTHTIAANASDNDAVSHILLLIDGEEFARANRSAENFTIDTFEFSDGNRTAAVRAYDEAGLFVEENEPIVVSNDASVTVPVENRQARFEEAFIGRYLRLATNLNSSSASARVQRTTLPELTGLAGHLYFSVNASSLGPSHVVFALPKSMLSENVSPLRIWHLDLNISLGAPTVVSVQEDDVFFSFSAPRFSSFLVSSEYPSCSEEVSETCMCGSEEVDSGYCCSGVHQQDACGTSSPGTAGGGGGGGSFTPLPERRDDLAEAEEDLQDVPEEVEEVEEPVREPDLLPSEDEVSEDPPRGVDADPSARLDEHVEEYVINRHVALALILVMLTILIVIQDQVVRYRS